MVALHCIGATHQVRGRQASVQAAEARFLHDTTNGITDAGVVYQCTPTDLLMDLGLQLQACLDHLQGSGGGGGGGGGAEEVQRSA